MAMAMLASRGARCVDGSQLWADVSFFLCSVLLKWSWCAGGVHSYARSSTPLTGVLHTKRAAARLSYATQVILNSQKKFYQTSVAVWTCKSVNAVFPASIGCRGCHGVAALER